MTNEIVNLKEFVVKRLDEKNRAAPSLGWRSNMIYFGCPYRKSDPDVLVVQSAEMRLCEDPVDA